MTHNQKLANMSEHKGLSDFQKLAFEDKTGFWTYQLLCKDGVRYIGYTRNLFGRLEKHFSGKGAMVTKKYPPIEVVSARQHGSEEEAKKEERNEYLKCKKFYGKKCRGAGHTKST